MLLHAASSFFCALALSACVSTQPPSGDIPPTESDTREVELAAEDLVVIGDQGTGSSEQYAVAKGIEVFCKSRQCDAGLTVGDNFYPGGVVSPLDPQFQDKFEKPYRQLPFSFYPTLGNHDYLLQWQAQVSYHSPRWQMPNRYYKLATAQADVFAIDTEHFDAAQRAWLEKGLSASSGAWKVVYGHRPVYSSGDHGDTLEMRSLLLPLLTKYKVDFYLAGHDHHLELQERDGVTYVVSGAAGKLRPVTGGKYSRFAKSASGFMHMDFSPGAVVVSFVGTSGQVLYSKRSTK